MLFLYNDLYGFIVDIIRSKRLILEMTKKDFEAKYLGSYLGIVWAFIQPTINILIFWFVFEVGFKSKPVENFPFILWFLSGILPWFFFSESVASATTSIVDYSYLVKKVVFQVSILPIIKLLSAACIHLFFIGVLFIIFKIYGYNPVIYNLQVFYYLFATFVLVLGISWITSSVLVFLRDIGQVVNMTLQFLFWLTPVFWSIGMVPEKYHRILQLNPVYYIIQGYRDSFIYHKWFWEDIYSTAYFWIITLSLLLVGAILFSRLRPHFADVL